MRVVPLQDSIFTKLFDMDNDGAISYFEYLLLVTFLSIPPAVSLRLHSSSASRPYPQTGRQVHSFWCSLSQGMLKAGMPWRHACRDSAAAHSPQAKGRGQPASLQGLGNTPRS